MKICIVGLGRLGAPFATCWLKRGFDVIGVDKNPVILNALQNKKSPVIEPQVEEILKEYGERLTVSSDIVESVLAADVTFVLVSTPSNPDGTFSSTAVVEVCQEIGKALVNKPNHIVIIASTVSPGTTNEIIIPTLEEASGKECGVDFNVCYVPEWVALGELVKGFLNPDFTIIGADNRWAGETVGELYRLFISDGEYIPEQDELNIEHMNIINAEISKVCLNAYIATKITFANAIADYCEQVPDANAAIVTAAIGKDARIGTKYFRGGTSYGGPCFPRDIAAFSALGGLPQMIGNIVDQCNRKRIVDLAIAVIATSPSTVGILGMAFKTGTAVIQDSPSGWLADTLDSISSKKINILLYDPLVIQEGISNDLLSVVSQCDTLIVMNPCKEFKTADPSIWESKTVIDCWGCLPSANIILGQFNEVFL